jgi:hypothetical protein
MRSAHTEYIYVFLWISEQTVIFSVCSINWLVYTTEAECLLRGTDWIFKSTLSLRLKGLTCPNENESPYRVLTLLRRN